MNDIEVYVGDNLKIAIGDVIDFQSYNWKRTQNPRFWADGQKLRQVKITRKEGSAPGDVAYYGIHLG